MNKVFSVDYYPAGQINFERALEAGDLEGALGELEAFFPPHTLDERERYDRVMMEGYRSLAKTAFSALGEKAMLADALDKVERAELGDYRSFGPFGEVGARLSTLVNYLKLGTPKEVAAKLRRLGELEKPEAKKKK